MPLSMFAISRGSIIRIVRSGLALLEGLVLFSLINALAHPSPRMIPTTDHIKEGSRPYTSVKNGGWAPLQNEVRITLLEPGKMIDRELAGGQSHSYNISLLSGQYLRLVVDQLGIDVAVLLFAPDGKKLAEVDSPNGTQGPEPLLFVSDEPGLYRVEVRSLEQSTAPGRYTLKIEPMRTATDIDRKRFTAGKIYAEAVMLQDEGTSENRRKAIDGFERALAIWRDLDDQERQAETLNNIGLNYNSLGEMQKALDSFNQSLPLRRAIGDRKGEAISLNNIAWVYNYMGERQKALDYYNQALPLRRATGDRSGEAATINNIGLVYRSLGETQKELDHYNKALAVWRIEKDRRGEAITLNNIGTAYSSMGKDVEALAYYEQALQLRRATGDRGGEATTLNNIGLVLDALGEKRKALDYYNQALPLRRATGDRSGEAATLTSIGWVYDYLGEKRKALDLYNQALTLWRAIGYRKGEGITLSSIGVVHSALGESEKALDYYDQALRLHKAAGDRAGEATTLYRLASLEAGRGRPDAARSQLEAALQIIESQRTKAISQELRSAYLASVQNYYTFYIDLLMQSNERHPEEQLVAAALQASEQARARTLLELLTESRADIRQGVDASLLERERALRQLLNANAEHRLRLLSNNRAQEEIAATDKRISELLMQYEEAEARIIAASPQYAALTHPQPLTVSEIQRQLLESGTLLIEYSLGEDRSYVWVVTSTTVKSFQLPGRAEIEASARRLYDLIIERNRQVKFEMVEDRRARIEKVDRAYIQQARALSRMIIDPIAAYLGQNRLLIVADGALQYVPFAALPVPTDSTARVTSAIADRSDGFVPLTVNHEIVMLPSASTLAVLRSELSRRKPMPKTLAILADPVFSKADDRCKMRRPSDQRGESITQMHDIGSANKRAGDKSIKKTEVNATGLSRLPSTRREAQAILALLPLNEVKVALDFKASRALAISAELGKYRFLHFATHGFLDALHPNLSGIALSMVDENCEEQDGFLRTIDIFNLKIPAELVVLSGCQTGLGKEIRGEGMIGLTRAFMYAGAARVMVSLWSVSDEATAELMSRFYKNMLGKRPMRPAAAIRAAQISMWKEKRWQSPYYWAAFVLQGEPR